MLNIGRRLKLRAFLSAKKWRESQFYQQFITKTVLRRGKVQNFCNKHFANDHFSLSHLNFRIAKSSKIPFKIVFYSSCDIFEPLKLLFLINLPQINKVFELHPKKVPIQSSNESISIKKIFFLHHKMFMFSKSFIVTQKIAIIVKVFFSWYKTNPNNTQKNIGFHKQNDCRITLFINLNKY